MLFKLCSFVVLLKSYFHFCAPKLGHILTGLVPKASKIHHYARYELEHDIVTSIQITHTTWNKVGKRLGNIIYM